ncbi:MAG: DUF6356 family protein [Pseudomonadota bacterium]
MQSKPQSLVSSLFFEHPAAVNETYFEHMGVALRIAGVLFVAGLAAGIHALIPGLCKTTARRKIIALHDMLQGR